MTLARDRYQSLLEHYGTRHSVAPALLRAQMFAESLDPHTGDVNPRAVSRVGAEGIFQAMPATFREVMGTNADPFNPETSILFGASYLARLLARYARDEARALAAYNWGMGHVDRAVADHGDAWGAHLPEETQEYLIRIAGYLGRPLGVAP